MKAREKHLAISSFSCNSMTSQAHVVGNHVHCNMCHIGTLSAQSGFHNRNICIFWMYIKCYIDQKKARYMSVHSWFEITSKNISALYYMWCHLFNCPEHVESSFVRLELLLYVVWTLSKICKVIHRLKDNKIHKPSLVIWHCIQIISIWCCAWCHLFVA